MDWMTTIITGICTGLGAGIGNYLATTYAIKHLEKRKEQGHSFLQRLKDAWEILWN